MSRNGKKALKSDITIHIPSPKYDSNFFGMISGSKTNPIPIPNSEPPASSRLSTALASPTSPEDAFLEFKLRKLLATSSENVKLSLVQMLLLEESVAVTGESWLKVQDWVNEKCNSVLGYERYVPIEKVQFSKASLPCPMESRIPDEMLMLIFSYLDAPGLLAAAQVNRRWNRVLHDNMLWHQLCQRHQFLDPIKHHFSTLPTSSAFGTNNAHDTSSLRPRTGSAQSTLSLELKRQGVVVKGSTSIQASHRAYEPNLEPPAAVSLWKSQFRDSYLTWCNWRRGQYRSSAIRDQYRGGRGNLCVGFDDERVLSVALGDDGRIWDMRSGMVKYRLSGHNGMITTVKFDEGFFVTGGVDGSVKLWDTGTGKCLATLTGHEGEIVCVQYDKRTVVAGSEDATVRAWDRFSSRLIAVLRGHEGAVTALHFDGDFVASGSVDHTIKLWSLGQQTCLKTLNGHANTVYSLQIDSEYIVSGSEDYTIRVWSRRTGQTIRVLRGHVGAVVCLQFDRDKIVSGSNDGTVKVWDLQSGKLLYSLAEHSAGIWNLRFDKTKIMTSSFDQSIRIWDFASVSSMSV